MKYLIAGLGNIGAEYAYTRHNVGFQVVDLLAQDAGAAWEPEHLGAVARVKHKGRTLVLLKPSTYMNRSGKAVRYWLQKEKIETSNLLVILDEINLPFGKQRLRPSGSDGGHNGLKDIDAMLGHNNYARLRIGIGADFPKGRQAEFVLSDWNEEEQAKLPEILKTAAETVRSFVAIGLQQTMNLYNKK